MNRKNFLPDRYPAEKQSAGQPNSDPTGSGKKNSLPIARGNADNINVNRDPIQEDALFDPHDLALTDC